MSPRKPAYAARKGSHCWKQQRAQTKCSRAVEVRTSFSHCTTRPLVRYYWRSLMSSGLSTPYLSCESKAMERPNETTTLYRPTGEQELALIRDSGFRAFPPRLSWQPIFYPVLFEEYAIQIARDWNARDGKRGYVTCFAVRTDFLARYQVHQV